MRRNHAIWALATVATLASLLMLAGCERKTRRNESAAANPDAAEPAGAAEAAPIFQGPATAANLLPRLAETYRSAPAYSDQGVFRIHYRQRGEAKVEETPIEVAFTRPGRLRVRAYSLDLLCDRRILAHITDEASNDFDRQQISAEPPAGPLSLSALQQDAILWEHLSREPGGLPLTLQLLIGQTASNPFTADGIPASMLPVQGIDGRPCHRLALQDNRGRYVLWIDSESYCLRRIDYPVAQRRVEDGVEVERMVAEFRDAVFSAPPDARFQWTPRGDAKLVRQFVPPPSPVSPLLGKKPPAFGFALPSGERLEQAQLEGRPAVLMWFRESETCQLALRQLEAVRASPAGAAAQFVAISAESTEFGPERLRLLQEMWRLDLVMAQDLDACGRDVFQIAGLPALVVLDSNGRVQVFDVGFHPALPQELALVLEMLRSGEDVAEKAWLRYRAEEAAYRQELVKSGAEGINAEFPVAPRSEPQSVSLTRLWSEKLQQPGNMATLPRRVDGGSGGGDAVGSNERVAVLNGLRSVRILPGGAPRDNELSLPDGASVSGLQCVASPKGDQWRLAAGRGAAQTFLYRATLSDAAEGRESGERWSLALAHPDSPQKSGIQDSLLTLDATGAPLVLLAHAGGGVHALDAAGKRIWVQRACDDARSLALLPGRSDSAASAAPALSADSLVVSDGDGALHQFDLEGTPLRGAHRIGQSRILQIHWGRFLSPQATPLCGLAINPLGQLVAVGIDANLAEVWNYEMPPGAFATPVEFVASGHLLGDEASGQWVFVTPDGGVHLVGADGAFHDHFYSGQAIRGVAVGMGALYLASDGEVTAWRVERRR